MRQEKREEKEGEGREEEEEEEEGGESEEERSREWEAYCCEPNSLAPLPATPPLSLICAGAT